MQSERDSNNAKIDQGLSYTYYFFLLRCLTVGALAFAFAFFAGGLSITSISESALIVDALRLPGCLLPTDDRSKSGGSSDLDAEPRVSDCCVGLWSRDDATD